MLKGSHLLWSKKKRKIGNDKLIRQREKFEDWVNVMNIRRIKQSKGNGTSSFSIVVGQKIKYVWKAESVSKREDWVMELEGRQSFLSGLLDDSFLSGSS